MNAHTYAVTIEHILRNIFGFCDRGGLGGLIDADSIEHNCYPPIACAFGYIYAIGSAEKKEIVNRFIDDYEYYLEMGIRGIIEHDFTEDSFDNAEQVLNAISNDLSRLV